MTPDVSVVIPTRDRWGWLRRAVEASLAQDGAEIEVIVVDDGSAEPVEPHLRALGDERVRVIRHDASRGVAAARNAGIAAAAAPWVALLDDDDVVAPDHLARLREVAAPAGTSFAFARHYVVTVEGAVLSVGPATGGELSLAKLLLGNPVVTPSSVMARRDLLLDAGGFDPGFSILADWDLWIRLAVRGRVVGSGALTVGYTQHGSNMAGDRAALLAEHRALAAKHAAVLDGARTGLGDDLFWQWWAAGVAPERQRRLGARRYLSEHRGRTPVARQVRALARLARAPRLPLAGAAGHDGGELAWLAPVTA